jgi:hypothetical protein
MQVITRINRYEYQVETLQAFRFVPLRGRFGFDEES